MFDVAAQPSCATIYMSDTSHILYIPPPTTTPRFQQFRIGYRSVLLTEGSGQRTTSNFLVAWSPSATFSIGLFDSLLIGKNGILFRGILPRSGCMFQRSTGVSAEGGKRENVYNKEDLVRTLIETLIKTNNGEFPFSNIIYMVI